MEMTRVEIAGVVACECPEHARVVLFDPERRRKLRVRIHAHAGQALLAEIAGIPSDESAIIDLMRDALNASETSLDSVILRIEDDNLCAKVRVRRDRGVCEIEAEPCEALLVAKRLDVEVFVEDGSIAHRASDQIPAAYRRVVEHIDFSGLDEP